jgi:tetratricopeptide (TPR) repeat protein
VFSGDLWDYTENSISYIHKPYPDTDGINAIGIGYDFNIKYPFYLAKDYITLFPMLGLESRLIFNISDPWQNTDDYFGIGIKVGAGFDVSLTPAFYLRGTAFYQPEFTSFLNSYPGFRFNASLGYRTWGNETKTRLTQWNNEQAAKRKAQEKKRSEERAFVNAATADPDNPKPLYDLGVYRYADNKNVTAAEAWEKALKLDPDFRVKDARTWPASTASEYGVAASGGIPIYDYSLQLLIAFADTTRPAGLSAVIKRHIV